MILIRNTIKKTVAAKAVDCPEMNFENVALSTNSFTVTISESL